jgi:hypothetical protein
MIWLTVLLNWLWGLDMYIWNMFRYSLSLPFLPLRGLISWRACGMRACVHDRVNYALIFKFDIRSHVRWQQLLESAAIFTGSLFFDTLRALHTTPSRACAHTGS